MMLAAARAASSASGESFGANSPIIARVVSGLRDASAQAMNVPARCCSLSDGSIASDERLSFRSFAYSGRRFFRTSRDIGSSLKEVPDGRGRGTRTARDCREGLSAGLRSLQDRFAFLPIAGAEFVRLQSI